MCEPYETLADRLRPFNVSVALVPLGDGGFSAQDAVHLASNIEADWVVPYGAGETTSFVEHILGHHPEMRFKIFERGERWVVPEELA